MTKSLQENALKILKEEVDKRNFKDINYIIYLTSYLTNSKDDILDYQKHVKKSIKFLEKNFDETYLLLFSLENGIKVFKESENSNYLFFIDYLITLLNQNDFIKFSDKLTDLKGKIELGYNRYFNQNKEKVKQFTLGNNFEIYNNLNTPIDFRLIIRNLIELKETKNKSFNKELKKYDKYFEFFPKDIYNNKTRYILEIEKSLYHNSEIKTLELKKQKVLFNDLNYPDIAFLILDLI
jgi:hypothetical protein